METLEPRSRWNLGLAAVLGLGALKLALHLLFVGRFGYEFFVDEFYYLEAARHLAWGFVDMPPLFPALTALVRATLGDSLLAVRLVPALAGAGLVVLTGLLARRLGGGVFAQALAALSALIAPVWLAFHSIHTMNALEPLFWTGCAWLLVALRDGGNPRLWLAFGALSGVGLLNKHSMAFFGVSVVVALLLSWRRPFRSPWIWLGGGVALLLFLPNLLWVVGHGFPHLEMLANIAENQRNVALDPLGFLGWQVLMLHPLTLPVWGVGLVAFLGGRELRRYRVLGITYLVVIALMLLLNGRPYYPAGAYPMLLAGGAVAIERFFAARLPVRRIRWLQPACLIILGLGGALLVPFFLPCLSPEAYVRYSRTLGFEQPRIENHRLGRLPQLFADQFGWREMAVEVATVYQGLPEEERSRVVIFGQNYGQAGAVDLYGPRLGLPPAMSGHLAYHDWGAQRLQDADPRLGEVMIVLEDDRETLEQYFESVELAGRVEHPYSMPYENFDIHVCRRPRQSLAAVWPRLRHLD